MVFSMVYWFQHREVVMKYRVEYEFSSAESGGFGKKEFEAGADEEAISLVSAICQEAERGLNESIENRFWHSHVHSTRLFKIHQPEVSTEIEVLRSVV